MKNTSPRAATRGHAIVIGASMAGLIAARTLSDRFARVTVLDRDAVPDEIANRRGVPQGWHGHGLLASGFGALQQLFPGLGQALVDAGAVPGDVIGDVRWFQHGYYKAKFQAGFRGILLSRPLLEGTLRQMVRRLPNVAIVDQTHVTGLLADVGGRRVTGVRIRAGAIESRIDGASLVVDASGRASRSSDWLAQLGYSVPVEAAVNVGLGYMTRLFRRRPHDLDGDMGAIIAPNPPHQRRVGFMLAQEGDRWIVTLGGWLGDHAPSDPLGFEEFARSLARPDIYEVIRTAEPLSDAVAYAFPSNLRRYYERLTRFPEQYLVIGDAVCSFNPFYGQGMSVAALEGVLFAKCLDGGPPETLSSRFYRDARGIVETPWMIAAGSDFAFPGVTGSKPAGTDLVNWYLRRVHRVASTDREVCRSFFDVANLLKPATALFAPRIVGRVIAGSLRADVTSVTPRADAGAKSGRHATAHR
jgi:2-polyprenyl-6-methoxyphenol hydroxylase-like FAD-dependent oxidoreductase